MDYCVELHQLFNNMTRLNYKNIKSINYKNGIYIVFEKGEKYLGIDRIVRVGTHTSDNRLVKRLEDHFIRKNKDGSIFRKNVGKSLLSKRKDEYLDMWSIDTSNKRKTIEKYGDKFDILYQKDIESEVTDYMINNFTFVCFEVSEKYKRLRLEEAIIATVNRDENFKSSSEWLGNYSPVSNISESGMWLRQGLNGIEIKKDEFNEIERFIEINK